MRQGNLGQLKPSGICRVLTLACFAFLTSGCFSAASVGPLADIHDCAVSGVKLGATQRDVESQKSKPVSRRDLNEHRYELQWKDGSAICFGTLSKSSVEIYGFGLSLNGRQLVKKGMDSATVLAQIEPQKWPTPTIVGPENHAWTQQPLPSMYYCDIRYQLNGGACSIYLRKDSVESVNLKVDP